ncbi:MAG: heme lyase CcmF/NrfE family subunit [Proteobacteria bacterium]|nr:heme lyase CcmF/NrfE family subunit [Pseudomonadota bacterium]
MIPELGHFALILAFCFTLVQSALPLLPLLFNRSVGLLPVAMAARLQFVCTAVAFFCLMWAFVSDDFSVAYVANNSNTEMPLIYKISSVWGAHEGSLLLWLLMLSGWSAAVSFFSRALPAQFTAQILAVLGFISIGFQLFTLLTSNPFLRLLSVPLQGRELNPLLQDFGLAVHPPMLYMGYVGFSVCYAFTVAALWNGRMDAAWARWVRVWTNSAWIFLTLGITLGSWWAYYELGWGGWWFWDPVENVSFMPWLAGTALLHSLAAVETRGRLRIWTAFLALLTFSLCLLGTFIVRSGILTSVHSFASDPARGLFILIFLIIVIGSSLLLFGWRMPLLRQQAEIHPISREGGILFNNVFLSAALVAVLIGTLYPLLLDALGVGKMSVGPPYFNSVFLPLTIPLALFVGIGGYTYWKKDTLKRLLQRLRLPAGLAIVGGGLLPLFFISYHWAAALGLMLALWVASASGKILTDYRGSRPGLAVVGMVLAHCGLAAFIAGVTMVSSYGAEKDVRLAVGEGYALAGYRFVLAQPVEQKKVANYQTQIATIEVWQGEQQIATLHPEKRRYVSQQQPLAEAGIDAGIWRDLYVSLGEPLEQVGQDGIGGAWSVRLQVKPLIRWIWGGAVLMALGALLAAVAKQRRVTALV